jgi:hypothetical protein
MRHHFVVRCRGEVKFRYQFLVWDSGVSSTPKPRNFDGPRQKFA